MPFCKNCGVASVGEVVFCPSCGTKTASAGQTVTSSSLARPAIAAKSSSATKILLVVAALVVCAVAGLVYAGHWAKNKAQAIAAANGIALPSDDTSHEAAGTSSSGTSTVSQSGGALLDLCKLISQEDADAVLGEPTKRSEHAQDDKYSSHCSYVAVEETHGANTFGVEVHNDESPADARRGQAVKKTLYSNFAIYNYQELSGFGDAGFLAVSKPPQGAAFESGPLAAMIARQQILMMSKGSKDIEIIVSYFGKERSPESLKTLTKKLADQI
jgi:hypothetical protein